MNMMLGLFLWIFSTIALSQSCTGHFVNPLQDICWRCLFPLSIGNHTVVKHHLADTPNASNAIGSCPTSIGQRIGLNIGYWEPMALVEVTDTPYCLVNLGGHRLNLGGKRAQGGRQSLGDGLQSAFYEVHWYTYPLISWLNVMTECKEVGDFGMAYMSELDPTWRDSDMSSVLHPEALLFSNIAAQSACAADALQPLDKLFWCAGAQGSIYPLTGHVNAAISPVQTALLLSERLNFKLHQDGVIADSNPNSPCQTHHELRLPKSRYRYEMVNQVPDGKHCYPSGHNTLAWEAFKIKPDTPSQYGFLVWRKRNCVLY